MDPKKDIIKFILRHEDAKRMESEKYQKSKVKYIKLLEGRRTEWNEENG